MPWTPFLLSLQMMKFISLDDIEFGVKQLANGKTKDIEAYQAEIFKIGGPIFPSHTQALHTQSLIVPIF